MNIYDIDNHADIVGKIQEIQSKISDEVNKGEEKADKKKIFDLIYQQLIQGMKLNTGIRRY